MQNCEPVGRKTIKEISESARVVSPVTFGLKPSKGRVLVVDDAPEMRRYLRILLEADSYRVETASNGLQALQSLSCGCIPEVVLLDLEMPGIDGLETLRRIQEFRPRPKVIICSGVEDPLRILQAATLGADSFLTKPVQHLYLSAAIERCLMEDPPKTQLKSSCAQVFVLPSPSST